MWWEESTTIALTVLFGLGELYNVYLSVVTGVDDEDWGQFLTI